MINKGNTSNGTEGKGVRTTKRTIGLHHLIDGHAGEIRRMVEDAPDALDPEFISWLPIVRPSNSGLVVVDGFSRLAGMVAFGAEKFDVIVAEGADVLCAEIDCDSVIGECAELDAIYANFDEVS